MLRKCLKDESRDEQESEREREGVRKRERGSEAIKVYDAAAAVRQKCHQVLHESAGGNEDCATEVLNQPAPTAMAAIDKPQRDSESERERERLTLLHSEWVGKGRARAKIPSRLIASSCV